MESIAFGASWGNPLVRQISAVFRAGRMPAARWRRS